MTATSPTGELQQGEVKGAKWIYSGNHRRRNKGGGALNFNLVCTRTYSGFGGLPSQVPTVIRQILCTYTNKRLWYICPHYEVQRY